MENLSGGFVISPMNAICLQYITMTNNSQCTPMRFFYLTNSHFSQHHTFICHNISLSCIHFPIIAISHICLSASPLCCLPCLSSTDSVVSQLILNIKNSELPPHCHGLTSLPMPILQIHHLLATSSKSILDSCLNLL